MIFVSFGKVQTAIFFDKINFENFLLIKVYIQNIKNWERASKIQELFKPLLISVSEYVTCGNQGLRVTKSIYATYITVAVTPLSTLACPMSHQYVGRCDMW